MLDGGFELFKKVFAIMLMILSSFTLCACNNNYDDVVRIHIRANSNCEIDQQVKLIVRDDVVELITPLIAECKSSQDVKDTLSDNLCIIEETANNVLRENGFSYVSHAKISNEYFPTRDYDGKTFPSDYYDALIVELGSGKGDNWWCVAYPPLCFVGKDVGTGNIKYKSKIIELINKYFG